MKTKKLISLLLILILLCGMLASCSKETESGLSIPSNMQSIVSEAGDYELIVPSEWLVETTQGMTSAYVEDQARSNITVCANELSADIASVEAYWDYFSAQFSAVFSDFTMLEAEPAHISIGSAHEGHTVDGLQYSYTATVGDVKYRWLQTVCLYKGTIYIITFTTTVDMYEEREEDLVEIFRYFYFS